MKIGAIVNALKGKEKGRVFVVVDSKDNFCYIADGKRLKKNKPKKKSVKHIQKASTKEFEIEQLKINNENVNCAIRKFLKNL